MALSKKYNVAQMFCLVVRILEVQFFDDFNLLDGVHCYVDFKGIYCLRFTPKRDKSKGRIKNIQFRPQEVVHNSFTVNGYVNAS